MNSAKIGSDISVNMNELARRDPHLSASLFDTLLFKIGDGAGDGVA